MQKWKTRLAYFLFFSFLFAIHWSGADEVLLLDTDKTQWQNWTISSGWSQQSLPTTAKRVYGVCRLKDVENNHWLRSPFVARGRGLSLHVELRFIMRECRNYPNPTELRHCGDTLGLYYRDTNAKTPVPPQWNEAVYQKETVIAPDRKWLDSTDKRKHMNIRVVRIQPSNEGMYLAIRDTGSCTAVYRVRIFYKQCPVRMVNFTFFPSTPAGHLYDVVDVAGKCVPGANLETVRGGSLSFCKADGTWHDANRAWCQCKPGYQPQGHTKCVECPLGTFKPRSGSMACQICPKNSISWKKGALNCSCNMNHYRNLAVDSIEAPCTRPPSEPQSLRIVKKTDTQVILVWEPPRDLGGRTDVQYYVTCRQCGVSVVFNPRGRSNEQKVSITGLSPSTHYNFGVHAINGVSDIAGRGAPPSTYNIDLQTNPRLSNKVVSIEISLLTSNSIFVSWKRPTFMSVADVIKYHLKICSLGASGVCNSYYSNKQTYQVNNLSSDTTYTVQIQVETISGNGEFSDLLTIRTLQSSADMKKHQSFWPAEHVIYVVIPCIIVVICIAILIAYFFNRRKSDTASVEESITPYSNIICSTPGDVGKFYVDPHTYEDLTDAVRDFTQEIDSSWVKIDHVIGGGEFGDVCKGLLMVPGRYAEVVAIKTLKDNVGEKSRSDFLLEASIMGQFRHCNVIRLIGVATKTQPTMIVTEFMQNGSLDKYLKKKIICTRTRLKLLRGIACGMSYLASMGFVHRDLAARNILVDQEGTCKVSDFGLSRALEEDTSDGAYFTRGGKIPVRWTAPEAINFRKYTSSSDVWSFGIVMWEVFTGGERPYWDWTNHEVIQSVNNGFRLPAPCNCSAEIYRLMMRCWDIDRLARPNFLSIVSSIDQLISNEIRERPPAKPPTPATPVLCPYTMVDEWLHVIGLERYIDLFRLHGIYFLNHGYQLTQDILINMGVSSAEDRLILMNSIEAARFCLPKADASEGCFV